VLSTLSKQGIHEVIFEHKNGMNSTQLFRGSIMTTRSTPYLGTSLINNTSGSWHRREDVVGCKIMDDFQQDNVIVFNKVEKHTLENLVCCIKAMLHVCFAIEGASAKE
jgi:hypothetical protein